MMCTNQYTYIHTYIPVPSHIHCSYFIHEASHIDSCDDSFSTSNLHIKNQLLGYILLTLHMKLHITCTTHIPSVHTFNMYMCAHVLPYVRVYRTPVPVYTTYMCTYQDVKRSTRLLHMQNMYVKNKVCNE